MERTTSTMIDLLPRHGKYVSLIEETAHQMRVDLRRELWVIAYLTAAESYDTKLFLAYFLSEYLTAGRDYIAHKASKAVASGVWDTAEAHATSVWRHPLDRDRNDELTGR